LPNVTTKSFPLKVSLFGLTALLLALSAGCATAPPAQEMSDARQSLETAQTIGAEEHAPEVLDNAQQLLSRAETDMQSGNYEEAQKDAVAALEAARQAVAITQAKQEPVRIIAEPEPAPEPVAQPAPEPALPSHYVVETKDNLWGIAAKPSVYGDARLWPLLLKANAKLIKRPDVIKAGTTLRIDRTPSPEEVETAINYSRKRGTGPLKALDIGYLRQYGLR
jgi:nucleoid-associated protein YgaU